MWVLVAILLFILAPGIMLSIVYFGGIIGAILIVAGISYEIISWIIKTIKSNL